MPPLDLLVKALREFFVVVFSLRRRMPPLDLLVKA